MWYIQQNIVVTSSIKTATDIDEVIQSMLYGDAILLVDGSKEAIVTAVYLSLTTYHQEMVPTPLLLSISASREGVPFPTVIEMILMLVVFEILREAGCGYLNQLVKQ